MSRMLIFWIFVMSLLIISLVSADRQTFYSASGSFTASSEWVTPNLATGSDDSILTHAFDACADLICTFGFDTTGNVSGTVNEVWLNITWANLGTVEDAFIRYKITAAGEEQFNFNVNPTPTSLTVQSYNITDAINVVLTNLSNIYLCLDTDKIGGCGVPNFTVDSISLYVEWTLSGGADTIAPNVTLINPINNFSENTRSINFTFNATTNDNFANCSLYTNETSWSVKQTDTTITNASLSGINETFDSDGDFLWNIRCSDTDGNYNFSVSNFTILIDSTAPIITNQIINATPFLNGDVNFTVTATDNRAMDNCLLVHNATGSFVSQGVMLPNLFSNFTFDETDNWNAHTTIGWYGRCNDTFGNFANGTTQIFTIQNTLSTVTINDPPTNTIFENVNLSTKYTYNDDDLDLGTCRLYLNGTINATNTSIAAGTQTNITSTITVAGDYLTVVGCNDGFTEINSSSIVLRLNLTVVDNPPTISSDFAINISWGRNGQDANYDVTVSDDNQLDTVLFEIDGVNVTASNTSNLWNYTDTCSSNNGFNWTDIWANDTAAQNSTLTLSLSWICDITVPVVGGKTVNATSVYTNAIVSFNVSGVTDNFQVNTTFTTINFPDGTKSNSTMTSIGNNVFQVNISVGGTAGTLTYNTTYANDTAGNLGSNTTVLSVTVNAPPEAPSPRFIIRNSSIADVLWITDIGELFFDLNDYIVYDLSGNRFLFYINNVVVFCINSTGGFRGNNTC